MVAACTHKEWLLKVGGVDGGGVDGAGMDGAGADWVESSLFVSVTQFHNLCASQEMS